MVKKHEHFDINKMFCWYPEFRNFVPLHGLVETSKIKRETGTTAWGFFLRKLRFLCCSFFVLWYLVFFTFFTCFPTSPIKMVFINFVCYKIPHRIAQLSSEKSAHKNVSEHFRENCCTNDHKSRNIYWFHSTTRQKNNLSDPIWCKYFRKIGSPLQK